MDLWYDSMEWLAWHSYQKVIRALLIWQKLNRLVFRSHPLSFSYPFFSIFNNYRQLIWKRFILFQGLCDNLLLCTARAWDLSKPFLFCPAMNTRMYDHPVTEEHIEKLKKWGLREVACITKTLMCGETGNGAMAEVQTICQDIVNCFSWNYCLIYIIMPSLSLCYYVLIELYSAVAFSWGSLIPMAPFNPHTCLHMFVQLRFIYTNI